MTNEEYRIIPWYSMQMLIHICLSLHREIEYEKQRLRGFLNRRHQTVVGPESYKQLVKGAIIMIRARQRRLEIYRMEIRTRIYDPTWQEAENSRRTRIYLHEAA